MNQKEYERRIDAITKCGANRGPHDYIPLTWLQIKEVKRVEIFMCRVCFHRVNSETLIKHFPLLEV